LETFNVSPTPVLVFPAAVAYLIGKLSMVLSSQPRAIDEKERRYLRAQRKRLTGRRAHLWRNGVWAYAFFGILAGLTILADREKPMINFKTDSEIIIGFYMAFSTIVGVPTLISERRRLARLAREYDQVLANGTCSDLRIRSKRMWEFEEQEDEGQCYAFELEAGGVAFVEGQDFYAGARFPNSDFSLIEFRTSDGKLIDMMLEKRGTKLVAERVISGKEKEALDLPEHATFLEGTLEQVYGNLKTGLTRC
jgi:hypothetical protein